MTRLPKQISLIVFVYLIILGTFMWAGFSHSQEIRVDQSASQSPPTIYIKQPISLIEKIREGVTMLKKSPPLSYELKPAPKRRTKSKAAIAPILARKQIALAVLNSDSGNITEERYWINEDKAKQFNKTGILDLEPADNGHPLAVNVRWWNSFNSYFEFPDQPHSFVIANKYLLPSSVIATLPERSSKPFTDIVYIPYSPTLQTPEMIESGKQYLDTITTKAFNALDQAKVKSHVLPDSLITSLMSAEFIKNIATIEHIDPQEFALSDDNGKALTERILTIIGANRELAFRYTGSPAGANGLAQFIAPTYRSMIAQYPEAKLIKNYMLGMADHVNAIEAMVLFFDSHKKTIGTAINQPEIIKELGITEEMLAAAYNGGPTRVVRSLNKYGLAWFSAQSDIAPKKTIFPAETLQYISKFSAIKSLHIF